MKRNLFALAVATTFAAPLALAAGNDANPGSSAQGSQGATQGQQLSAAETFNRLDSNNDGFISKPEAGLMPDVIVIFPVADTDKDDKLSRSELNEGMKNRSASAQGSSSSSQGSSSQGASSSSQGASQGRSSSKAGQGNAGYTGPSSGSGAASDTEGVYSPKGDAGGDPLGASPAGRSGSGSGR